MTGGRCLTSETLARYVTSTLAPEWRAAADEHLAMCAGCRERVDMLQRLAAANAGELDAAMDEAEGLVARLLGEPEHRWPLLAQETMYHHPELARRLIALAVDERERDTRRAAQLAHTAGVIADSLTADARKVLELRFDAWKLESALLREAGRYEECRAALVRAEDAAEQVPDVEMARAATHLSRALVCAEPDVWSPDEALALLDRAEAVYVRRNAERWRAVLTLRGMLLLRMGNAWAAKERFETVLAQTPPDDEAAYADAQMNLAHALINIGDAERAMPLLDEAYEVSARLPLTAAHAATLGLRALSHQSREQHADAIRDANAALERFAAAGRPEEAIRVGLIAVESHLAMGEYEAGHALCLRLAEESIALDRREPSRRRALTAEALAYLREFALHSSLIREVVTAVRAYIDDLATKPVKPFRPPLPVAKM